MASQMAQLLVDSDLAELEEVVRRWVAEAVTDSVRAQYRRFGGLMLEFKRRMEDMPVRPSREDLEASLSMMMAMAVSRGVSG